MKSNPARSCDLCHDELPPGRADELCEACREWDDYWNSLTPAQQRKELDMMSRHAAEQGRD